MGDMRIYNIYTGMVEKRRSSRLDQQKGEAESRTIYSVLIMSIYLLYIVSNSAEHKYISTPGTARRPRPD